MSNLMEVLDRPIAFQRVFVDVGGSILAALFLSQSVYWQKRCPPNRGGWWWKSIDDWEKETGLNYNEQRKARKSLVNIGVLEEEKKGVPCRTWYRVNLEKLESIIQFSATRKTGFDEKQVCRNMEGKFSTTRKTSLPQHGEPISKTTTKITSEITSKPAKGGKPQSGLESLTFAKEFGIEFPMNLKPYVKEHEAVAIAARFKLDTEAIRLALGEMSAMSIRGFKREPISVWAWVCRETVKGKINLSALGEKNMPQWAEVNI